MNNFYFLCKIGSGKAAKEQLAAVEKHLGTGNGGGSADPMTVEPFRPPHDQHHRRHPVISYQPFPNMILNLGQKSANLGPIFLFFLYYIS